VLRDHPLFERPIRIDRSRTIRRDGPSAWKGRVDGPAIDVLPLVRDPSGEHFPGWCTYTEGPSESPEVEIFCGGVNDKTPTAAALWRQGNLLHFGFDLSPAEMNEQGQALLVDAIAYIARFTEDRPIMRTPSPFAGPTPEPRGRVDRVLRREDLDPIEGLKWIVAPSMLAAADPKDRAAYRRWFEGVRDFVHADVEGKLVVDEDARASGIPPDRPGFFEGAIASLRGRGEAAARARLLLARYVPEGLGSDAPADLWAAWYEEHRPYLFFSDVGGYRWYVDPLAERRRIPTARLRGPDRSDRQPRP
jgi:hypothetical protein